MPIATWQPMSDNKNRKSLINIYSFIKKITSWRAHTTTRELGFTTSCTIDFTAICKIRSTSHYACLMAQTYTCLAISGCRATWIFTTIIFSITITTRRATPIRIAFYRTLSKLSCNMLQFTKDVLSKGKGADATFLKNCRLVFNSLLFII